MCFANYSIMWATKKCSEWMLVSGYSREKGALISQITKYDFFCPTFARKITAFEGKEMGLMLCKMNSARRSTGSLLPGEKPAQGDCKTLIDGCQSLQLVVATFSSSSWPTPGPGGHRVGLELL